LANRDENGAQIFAAGFDSSRNIFLGEKATKWEGPDHEVDGLTTNGILMMQPKGIFCTDEKETPAKPGIWREISVRSIHIPPIDWASKLVILLYFVKLMDKISQICI
jgi:hypothetical protein